VNISSPTTRTPGWRDMEGNIGSLSGLVYPPSMTRNTKENDRMEDNPVLFFVLLAEHICLQHGGLKK